MIYKFENENKLRASYEALEKEFTKKCQELAELKRQQSKLLGEKDEKGGEDPIQTSCEVENEKDLVNQSAENISDNFETDQAYEDKANEINELKESQDLVDKSQVEKIFENDFEPIENLQHEFVETNNTRVEESVEKESAEVSHNFRKDANAFLLKHPEAKPYAKEIVKMIVKDKSLLLNKNPFLTAFALCRLNEDKSESQSTKVVEKNFDEVTFENSEGGLNKNLKNNEVLKKVFPPILGNNFGQSGVLSKKKFSSLDDCRAELIAKYFG